MSPKVAAAVQPGRPHQVSACRRAAPLRGLWGSFFSHKDGKALAKLPKRFWSRVELVAAAPVTPEAVSAPSLQSTVQALRGDKR